MITLKQAKDYLLIGCSDYDSLIKQIIEYSVNSIHSYIGYSLEQTSETDYYKGTNRQFLPLGKMNITTISDVKLNGEVLDPSKYSLRKNMLFKSDIWDAKYIGRSMYDTSLIDYNIEITYDYGYVYPDIDHTINSGTVPKEIQYVCVELVKRIFIKSGTTQQTKAEGGRRLDSDFSVDYYEIKINELLDKDMRRILNKYKK